MEAPPKERPAPDSPAEQAPAPAPPPLGPPPPDHRGSREPEPDPRRPLPPGSRPTPATPTPLPVALRKLRSRLPVSPLPWRWHKRWPRLALAAILLAAAGGAVASVLLQSEEAATPEAAASASVPPKVRPQVNAMSLPQKVDAVMVVGLADPDGAVADLRRRQLGGVLIGGNAWPGAEAGAELNAQLREAGASKGRIPPLIVARQEGGAHNIYPDLPPAEGQLEAGAAASPKLTRTWARQANRSLKRHGFDLNLAPLAEVATLDSPIADRSFGDDPALVASLTAAALRGCADAEIACAVGHFPGLGGASGDTAAGPATVGMDPLTLEARDLLPFRAALRAKAPAMILSLAFYSAYDPVTPAALSPAIAGELLRDQLGFKGVAITDDLSAGAISATYGAPEAAQAALSAGADMVLISDPGDARRARQALLDAARSGSLPPDRLDQAVGRVLQLKRRNP